MVRKVSDIERELLQLPVCERLRLVEAIWESIAECPKQLDLTEDQRDELDRRLEAYRKDPDAGSPWAEVKARVIARL